MKWLTIALVVILAGCAKEAPKEDGLTEAQIRQLDALTTLGYVVGTAPAPATVGVTINEPEAYRGLTLFTSRDRPAAFLIDMDGNEVWSWHDPGSTYWERVHLYPDGGLLAITSGPQGMVRLAHDGTPLWHYGGRAHHDMHVLNDGRIYVLTREWVNRPELQTSPVAEDFISELTPEGREVGRVSLLGAFTDSPTYCNWLRIAALPAAYGDAQWRGCDIFHTNSLQMFEGEGRLHALVSIRELSIIAIVDMESGLVIWAMAGMWRKQHEARWTDKGMMLFDNLGHEGRSKVIEFSPMTQEILWQYDDPAFFSKGAGSQQVLPNGNVLIAESHYGRIFEVTRKGRIVWEYYNPLETEDGKIVRIMRATRFGEGALAFRENR